MESGRAAVVDVGLQHGAGHGVLHSTGAGIRAGRRGVGGQLHGVSGARRVERLSPVRPRLSSNLSGASAAALPGDADSAGVEGQPIPHAGASDSATKLALAGPLPARADQPARDGHRPRPAGGRDGSSPGSELSSAGKPAFGQPSAAGAACPVHLPLLLRLGRHQLASGTGHPAYGSDAQGVGREPPPGRCQNPRHLGQHPANLPATGSAQYPTTPAVAMLPSAQSPGLGGPTALNNYENTRGEGVQVFFIVPASYPPFSPPG